MLDETEAVELEHKRIAVKPIKTSHIVGKSDGERSIEPGHWFTHFLNKSKTRGKNHLAIEVSKQPVVLKSVGAFYMGIIAARCGKEFMRPSALEVNEKKERIWPDCGVCKMASEADSVRELKFERIGVADVEETVTCAKCGENVPVEDARRHFCRRYYFDLSEVIFIREVLKWVQYSLTYKPADREILQQILNKIKNWGLGR